jgi:hypothetical protein
MSYTQNMRLKLVVARLEAKRIKVEREKAEMEVHIYLPQQAHARINPPLFISTLATPRIAIAAARFRCWHGL